MPHRSDNNLENPLIQDDCQKKSVKRMRLHTHCRDLPPTSKYANYKQEYNPFASPPDVDKAIKHSMASRVGVVKSTVAEADICEDCGLSTENELIPLCGSRQELSELGTGFVLYFGYLKYCGALLAIMFVVTGVYNIISYQKGTGCSKNSNSEFQCGDTWTYIMSLGHKSSDDSFFLSSLCNLIFVISGLIFLNYIQSKQNSEALEADRDTVTPSDFTIMVTGLPRGETVESIKEFFTNLNESCPAAVKKVCMSYDIKEYQNLIQQRDKLRYEKSQKNPPLELDTQLLLVETSLEQLKNNFQVQSEQHFTGTAFITFNTEKEADIIVERFNTTFIETFLYYTIGCCYSQESEFITQKTYKGKFVRISKAVEPTDVCWENLAYNSCNRSMRVFGTNIISLLLIAASYWLIFILNAHKPSSSESGKDSMLNNSLTTIISVLITIINMLLGQIVRSLVIYQKHATWTQFYRSLAKRLSFCQIVNSVVIILWIELKKKNYDPQLWSKNSLIAQMCSVFIMNAILPSIMKILDVPHLIKLAKRYLLISNPTESKLTQEQANKLFEGPVLDMGVWYAAVQKTMILTAFYATLLPYGILFSLGALFLTYWIEKYLLLRRVIRPRALGRELNDEMLDFLEYFFIAFAAGACIFELIVKESFLKNGLLSIGHFSHISPCNLLALLVVVVMFLLPEKLTPRLFRLEEIRDDNPIQYDQARMIFITDYDKTNPVTLEEANKEWLETLKNKDSIQSYYNQQPTQSQAFCESQLKFQTDIQTQYIQSQYVQPQLAQLQYGQPQFVHSQYFQNPY